MLWYLREFTLSIYFQQYNIKDRIAVRLAPQGLYLDSRMADPSGARSKDASKKKDASKNKDASKDASKDAQKKKKRSENKRDHPPQDMQSRKGLSSRSPSLLGALLR